MYLHNISTHPFCDRAALHTFALFASENNLLYS